jgi:hypothetical protein
LVSSVRRWIKGALFSSEASRITTGLFAAIGTRLVCPLASGYVADMKTSTVHVAKDQLSHVIAEAHPGDAIVLTDGERRVTLEASPVESGALDLDLEEDSPELAAELLKAAKSPFTPYSRQDLEAVAQQVLREKNRE